MEDDNKRLELILWGVFNGIFLIYIIIILFYIRHFRKKEKQNLNQPMVTESNQASTIKSVGQSNNQSSLLANRSHRALEEDLISKNENDISPLQPLENNNNDNNP